jgi:uncharacterized protein
VLFQEGIEDLGNGMTWMTDFEQGIVNSHDGLAALYAEPVERIAQKALDHVNAAGRAFIAASPFLVLATSGSRGLDCSPKGDRPGFVEISEDGHTLFIPDRRGNNRIDGLKNLVEGPRIGLIFFVPGANETFRVNGRAKISQNPVLTRRFVANNKEPATVLIVTVEEAFQHCAKALVRSDLWKAGTRGQRPDVPTMGEFVATRYPGTDSAAVDKRYNQQIPTELY